MQSSERYGPNPYAYDAWVLKDAASDELLWKTVKMLDLDKIYGTRNTRAIMELVDQIGHDELCIMKPQKPRVFYVLEYRLPYYLRGVPWYGYIPKAGAKCSMLYLEPLGSDGIQALRVEALRRSSKWISRCPLKEHHGNPVLVNLKGSVLRSS